MSSGFPPGASLYSFRRKEEIAPPSVARDAEYRGVFTVIVRADAAVFAASPPATDAGAGAGPPFSPFAAGAVTAAALSFPAVPPGAGTAGERSRSTGIRSGRRSTARSPGSSVFPWCPRSEKLDPPRQVDASLVKGMTPADPPDPVQHPEDRPVQADRSDHVLGAAGVEPAAVADVRGNRRLVQPQEADEELSGPHGESPSFLPTAVEARGAARRTPRKGPPPRAASGPRSRSGSPAGRRLCASGRIPATAAWRGCGRRRLPRASRRRCPPGVSPRPGSRGTPYNASCAARAPFRTTSRNSRSVRRRSLAGKLRGRSPGGTVTSCR